MSKCKIKIQTQFDDIIALDLFALDISIRKHRKIMLQDMNSV